jgi:hypothetical protein
MVFYPILSHFTIHWHITARECAGASHVHPRAIFRGIVWEREVRASEPNGEQRGIQRGGAPLVGRKHNWKLETQSAQAPKRRKPPQKPRNYKSAKPPQKGAETQEKHEKPTTKRGFAPFGFPHQRGFAPLDSPTR